MGAGGSSNANKMSGSGESFLFDTDSSFMQKFKSQYSQYNDLRGSFGSQLFSSQFDSKVSSGAASAAGKPTYVLNLHLLGLAGLPKAGWFERAPGYELIVHAGGVAKRIRPRIPAPPPGVGTEPVDLEECVPAEQMKVLQRLDDRSSVRCPAPGDFFRVDVWEERSPLVDLGNKGHSRVMLGQCYVPLEQKYNRRPCTWPIVNRTDKALTEVGFLTCKFGLATMPGPVQNLRVVEGTVGVTEMQLAWEPPETDGGTVLRGYRVEARTVEQRSSSSHPGIGALVGDETPRTASAPAVPEPSSVLRNLTGNTEYLFCVWAVSEAGPGTGAEVIGKTGAVAPGVCGLPQLAECDEGYFIQWLPPEESGGADMIAYRVWLRALFHNSLGEVWPAEGWIDLGLVEHRGDQSAVQQAPLRLDAMPAPCSGCLCSVSALSTAGLMGPSTPEVPILHMPEEVPVVAAPSPQPVSSHGSPDRKLPVAGNGSSKPASPAAVAEPLPPTRGHYADYAENPLAAMQHYAENQLPETVRHAADPLAMTVQHGGDPLAQYHPPSALAQHQLGGAQDSRLHSAPVPPDERRGLSDDAGAIADSQGHTGACSSSSTTEPQRREVVLPRTLGNIQAYARSEGAASSSSSPDGARSGSSPGGEAMAVAQGARGRGYGAEASQPQEEQAVQISCRVVDASEIRPAAETVRSGSPPLVARTSDLCTTRPIQAYYREAELLKTEEVVCAVAHTMHPPSPPPAIRKVIVAAEEAGSVLRQQLAGSGGDLEAAGSWTRGQKGSLSAGRPSFDLRSDRVG